jgi:integrase
MTRLFAKLVADSGLPPVTLHGLRHGAATLALAAGADLKIVQDQLGHSTVVLTADTYTNSRELHQPGEKSQVSASGIAGTVFQSS